MYHQTMKIAPSHSEVVPKGNKKMLEGGFIWQPLSPWSLLVDIATKENENLTCSVDYRVLNCHMKAGCSLLPKIQKIINELASGVYFIKPEFFSGYWQIHMSDYCKVKRMFVCHLETFLFEVMTFGMMNAPSALQRMMDEMLGPLSFVKVYLDDIVVLSKTKAEHADRLRQDFQIVSRHGLKVKMSNCEFLKNWNRLLGRIVGRDGVNVDPSKRSVIRDSPGPDNQTKLCRFHRIAGYYRRFMRSFASISASLHAETFSRARFI